MDSFKFNGNKIPFDPDGVWPMTPNPKMHMYEEDSKAKVRAVMFNQAYTRLLKSLEYAFNGHPESIGDAISMMHSLIMHLNRLMSTPIDDNGDPNVGPNAGPTFEFTPE